MASDLEGHLISWNEGGGKDVPLYGKGEAIGQSSAVLTPPDHVELVQRSLRRVLGGESVGHFETKGIAKDGSLIDGLAIPSSQCGIRRVKMIGASAICRDITIRLAAERNFRESEARFQEVFEHAPIGILVAGADWRFLHANPYLCSMLGYTESELSFKTWAEVTHPDDLAQSVANHATLTRDNLRSVEFEKRYRHRSGETVWARVRTSAVTDTGGRAAYFIVQVEDITERRAGGRGGAGERAAVPHYGG